ncbi:hypothetical protein J3Q64DRAFT_1710491, partial [Phycomyces blakesleeanus]
MFTLVWVVSLLYATNIMTWQTNKVLLEKAKLLFFPLIISRIYVSFSVFNSCS